jgi:hypothetical protein
MADRCLLIQTKDHRRFLTHEKSLPSLIEFAKTFGAEIYVVKPHRGATILKLKKLTTSICDSHYDGHPDCTRLEKLFPKAKRDRTTILSEARMIRRFIEKRFMAGKSVSLKELKEKYKDRNLTDACLCNHMSVVRKKMSLSGHRFNKIGAGNYTIAKSENE